MVQEVVKYVTATPVINSGFWITKEAAAAGSDNARAPNGTSTS